MTNQEFSIFEVEGSRSGEVPGRADPVVTELIRNSLNSAADQMKRTLIRTSFSPIVYEALDFTVVLYDRDIRLLAQAPTMPTFMGAMNFCVEAAVEGVGGEEKLEEGDILLYNWPYNTGTHAQDAAIVMPIFLADGELVGYAACKAHWMDIAAKDPYCSDTTDVFQEGVFFPGVKMYRRGEPNEDIMAMVRANTRFPDEVVGDINAQVACCRVGARELTRVIKRFGKTVFDSSVELIFDHAEQIVRECIEKIPDGVYSAYCGLDNSGVDDETIRFELQLEIAGSDVTVDVTGAPDALPGPMNCPLPSTISFSRVVIGALSDTLSHTCEGHFRPLKIITRPGSMYHPLPPAPCFMFGWGGMPILEGLVRAIGEAQPDLVPAASGACVLTLVWWGKREKTGEPWGAGSWMPIGQGAHVQGDGATAVHVGLAFSQAPSIELMEAKFPWVFERYELAADSGGAGTHKGGCGVNLERRIMEDCYFTSTVEQTKSLPLGLAGGQPGRANSAELVTAEGTTLPFSKITGMHAPKGSLVRLLSGGGGGYGDPVKRSPEKIHADLRGGYISEAFAREHYPQAFSKSVPKTK